MKTVDSETYKFEEDTPFAHDEEDSLMSPGAGNRMFTTTLNSEMKLMDKDDNEDEDKYNEYSLFSANYILKMIDNEGRNNNYNVRTSEDVNFKFTLRATD